VTDDDLIIDKDIHANYVIQNVTYSDGKPSWATTMEISSKYRGMRLIS
jgi:hypothetical protein